MIQTQAWTRGRPWSRVCSVGTAQHSVSALAHTKGPSKGCPFLEAMAAREL